MKDDTSAPPKRLRKKLTPLQEYQKLLQKQGEAFAQIPLTETKPEVVEHKPYGIRPARFKGFNPDIDMNRFLIFCYLTADEKRAAAHRFLGDCDLVYFPGQDYRFVPNEEGRKRTMPKLVFTREEMGLPPDLGEKKYTSFTRFGKELIRAHNRATRTDADRYLIAVYDSPAERAQAAIRLCGDKRASYFDGEDYLIVKREE